MPRLCEENRSARFVLCFGRWSLSRTLFPTGEALCKYTTKTGMKWLNEMINGVSERNLLGLFFML